ncbi:alkane hydroxylase MAH1 [Lactuca sativa]|uniref:alkane hydroxylase MAH1 n=1 Tax=Lactuca sativa TaxID=4236 RepID=UPI0022AEA0A1|nr:alkane hydroxylase MAH1 [Lactuca sativa]
MMPLLILILLYRQYQKQRSGIPTNWPILGMTPSMLINSHRIYDYATELLLHSGGTFKGKGPWFANMNPLLITNPLDVHHVLTKNFSNYPRGDTFRNIFRFLGDGLITSDGKLWEINHKVTISALKHACFQGMLETVVWNKVENGLLPILESISEHHTEVDLQDIFQRFTFDTMSKVLLDNDPECLSLDFPYNPCLKAFTKGEEALIRRVVTPQSLWKLQQLILRVGKESKLNSAGYTLNNFVYKCIAQNQNDYDKMINGEQQEGKFKFFTALMRELKDIQIDTSVHPTKFIRDVLITLMTAGKDSTASALSWFFYNVARNPTVEGKILKEIHTHFEGKVGQRWNTEELGKMVYLHGALCESLRLFSPVPFNYKSPLRQDILPSGHQVDLNTKIIISFYSMGRMKSVWGEDCMEFKPERWISHKGGIKHEPSYKFTTFSSGPRTCVGKKMALTQLQIVSSIIIYHYHFELVEDHTVLPAGSMVLSMKHGLKVKLTKRSEMN